MEMLYGPQVGTRNNFSGMVGGEFMAGSTNIAVTHLGFYDQDEDGLAASHHVGLFTGDGSTLLASVEVPVGTDALLTNGYRWVVLDVPLLLIGGSNYVLAAEVGAGDGDGWPDQFAPTNWNPVFVGTNGVLTREALWSYLPWPTAPLNGGVGNSIYGAPNLANWQVGSARVGVVQSSVVGYGSHNSTLAVVANGEAPVSLQWYQAPGTLLPGETNSILVFTNLTAGDAGNYYVIATNVLGSMQSSNITLAVLPDQPVSVTASPTNTSVFELFSATFYVSGTGSLPISYQWQRNGTPIPGAINASYVLAAASLTNAGEFSCVLSNFANSSPNVVTSGTGTLAVIPNTALPAQYFHPTQNGIRDDFSGSVGNYFEVGDSDTIVTHLGFYDSGGDGLAVSHHVGIFTGDGSTLLGEVLVPAGTSAYLGNGYRWMPLSPPLALTNNAYYLLGAEVTSGDGDAWSDEYWTFYNPLFVGTNGASTRSCTYTVDAWPVDAWPAPPLGGIGAAWANGTYGAGNLAMLPLGAPMVVVSPSSVTQYQGFQATFTALVSGQPPVDIQWYKAPNTRLSGQTNQALVLSGLSLTDSGNYYAVATNGAGTQPSDSVSLNVVPPTPPQLIQDLQSQTVYLHQGVQLAVTASGTPPPG